MANATVLDGAGASKSVKTTGVGTDGDPWIGEHKETSAAAILADTTAIIAKLSSDPATQTTLAALLAKMIAAPSTEAKQDIMETSLDAILAKLSADPATQTTLAAILAKIIAAPGTEAKQDTAITSLQLIDDIVQVEDAVHSTGDKGVMPLGVRIDIPTEHAAAGDYAPPTISEHGCTNVDPQHYATLDDMDATTGWTVINNDTDNLATATNHVWKTASLSFDKVDGAGNTIFAGIQKTLPSTNMNAFLEEGGGFFLGSMFFSSIADLAYVWFRVGTDSSNYNEWRVLDTDLTALQWNALRGVMRAPYSSTGNGWDSGAVTWMAIGAAFDAETNTLAAMLVDGLFANSGLQTSSDITSQVSSSVSSPNVRVTGYLGQVPTNAGNVTAGTQRIVVASDDVNLAAIKTSVEIMDDWDDGSDHAEVVSVAGEAHMGQVGGETKFVDVTMTPYTAGASADADCLADTTIVAACMRGNDLDGILQSIVLIDKADNAGILDIVFLSANHSLGTIGSTNDILATELVDILYIQEVVAADYVDFATGQVAVFEPNHSVFPATGTDDIYVGLISRDTKTYTASSLVLRLGFLQN